MLYLIMLSISSVLVAFVATQLLPIRQKKQKKV
jgi:hypothetical protein